MLMKKQKTIKIITRQIYENFLRRNLKKSSLPEKLDCILNIWGRFVKNCVWHFMSIYGQIISLNFFFFFLVLNSIDSVFCFLPLLKFLFKAWFLPKLLVLLKILISINLYVSFYIQLLFLSCMCLKVTSTTKQ